MRTMMKATMVAAFLAALALATGCEDTPLLAGKDYKMTLVAQPVPNETLKWNIYATVVSDTNVAQRGISVFFTSTAGTLGSNGQGVTTKSNGQATDVLTVASTDPLSITVTATSAALTKTVTVATGVCAQNTAPTAVISPADAQTLGAGTKDTFVSASDVVGTDSIDDHTAVGDLSYHWDCGDPVNNPSSTENHVTCKYKYKTDPVDYFITLTVTDNGLPEHTDCPHLTSGSATITVHVPAGT